MTRAAGWSAARTARATPTMRPATCAHAAAPPSPGTARGAWSASTTPAATAPTATTTSAGGQQAQAGRHDDLLRLCGGPAGPGAERGGCGPGQLHLRRAGPAGDDVARGPTYAYLLDRRAACAAWRTRPALWRRIATTRGETCSPAPARSPSRALHAREFDEESGLYFYRARYYDPAVGRFVSRDPIGINGGQNLYTYAENNPINQTIQWGSWGTKNPKAGSNRPQSRVQSSKTKSKSSQSRMNRPQLEEIIDQLALPCSFDEVKRETWWSSAGQRVHRPAPGEGPWLFTAFGSHSWMTASDICAAGG